MDEGPKEEEPSAEGMLLCALRVGVDTGTMLLEETLGTGKTPTYFVLGTPSESAVGCSAFCCSICWRALDNRSAMFVCAAEGGGAA